MKKLKNNSGATDLDGPPCSFCWPHGGGRGDPDGAVSAAHHMKATGKPSRTT